MTMPALAAGITAGGMILSDVIRNRMQKNRYSQEKRDLRKNWQMQNAYNQPTAQMQRLKQAGLNPNLVYQQGGAVSGAGEIGSANFGDAQVSDYSVPSNQFLAYKTANADIENKIAEAQGRRLENVQKFEDSKFANRTAVAKVQNLELANLESEQKRALLTAQTGLTREQTYNAQQEWFKLETEIEEINTRIGLNNEQKKQVSALIKQVNANTDLITQQYQKAIVETAIAQWEVQLKELDFNQKQQQFPLLIQQLVELVDDLQFHNSEEWREYQMTPDDNYSTGFDLSGSKHGLGFGYKESQSRGAEEKRAIRDRYKFKH